ncbi:MAG: type II toxin-antitoxin system death-on-curing family toxin [Candidatus Liptonbacteria bacterium]|nr:type II toxin-antitoxin system death-on-curing family toxin [Candidatus Liptonbacteria bacterium]
MEYLSAKDILQIHSLVLDETGGLHGVRDTNTILSLEFLPGQKAFGTELYPTIFEKAAVYARNIILGHPFFDGNKRTGITAAIVFLDDNGYTFEAEEGKVESFALEVVHKKLDLESISAWFRLHSVKRVGKGH